MNTAEHLGPVGVLRDPLTLTRQAFDDLAGHESPFGYYDFVIGERSRKNEAEAAHFAASYRRASAAEKSYANRLRFIEHPKIGADDIIVDLGCGPYPNIEALGGRQVLVDDLMGFYCEKLGFAQVPGLKLASRAELLPIASGSVDYVYSVNMIDHVDDMVDACLEIARILKPGGVLILQSYFNSFPLLLSEPGVFDGHFLDQCFLRIFRPIELTTFALGDPRISRSYNCDVIAGRFTPRVDWQQMVKLRTPRDSWAKRDYVGVQSVISEGIAALDDGRLDDARQTISELRVRNRPSYELHVDLLQMRLHILEGDYGSANKVGKGLRVNPRVARNVRILLTLERLENRRITMANLRPAGRSKESGDELPPRVR